MSIDVLYLKLQSKRLNDEEKEEEALKLFKDEKAIRRIVRENLFDGRTALILAAEGRYTRLAEKLLKNGADVSATDKVHLLLWYRNSMKEGCSGLGCADAEQHVWPAPPADRQSWRAAVLSRQYSH
jgi:ankyrin repeat protein